MALGARAQALLGSGAFKFVVEFLSESYANNILTSAAQDTATREQNFHHHRALSDIVSQLNAFVAAGQLVTDANQEPEE